LIHLTGKKREVANYFPADDEINPPGAIQGICNVNTAFFFELLLRTSNFILNKVWDAGINEKM